QSPLLIQRGGPDRAPTYRMRRNELDSPNSVRPWLRRWMARGPRLQDRANPIQERPACVTDRPRPEDILGFERQFPAQSGRLSHPRQRLCFPPWDEPLPPLPSYSHNSILHEATDGRASSECLHGHDHAGHTPPPAMPVCLVQWARSMSVCGQSKAILEYWGHARPDHRDSCSDVVLWL